MNRYSFSVPAFGLKKEALILNALGIGSLSRRMVFQRALELALVNGNSYHSIAKNHWETATWELTRVFAIDLPSEARGLMVVAEQDAKAALCE